MFFVSMADNHTGKFLGGVTLNAETPHAAQAEAVKRLHAKTGFDGCIQAWCVPLAKGSVIPPGAYGQVLSRAELEAAHGPLERGFAGDDGKVKWE